MSQNVTAIKIAQSAVLAISTARISRAANLAVKRSLVIMQNAITLGLIKQESWNATTGLPRVNGVEHYETRSAGSVLTVNILSCLALEAAYQRRKYTLLEARVASLENV